MMSRQSNFTRDELSSGQPVFLLDITWGNKTYYLSNVDIRVPIDANEYLDYVGAIQDFDFIESMDLSGTEIETNILTCAVIFDINPIEQFANGNPLEGSEAIFSYIVQKGTNITKYQNRVILLTGKVQEPQYGDPLESNGFVSFSVEQDLFSDSPILDPRLLIDARFPNRHIDTANGKPWPVFFGIPTGYSSPAYVVQEGTGTTTPTIWLIAGHQIEATQCTIQDDKFDTLNLSVSSAVDNNGNPYSRLSYTAPLGHTGLALPLTGGWASGTTRSYWIAYNSTHGGGLENPFGDGLLTGGGDLCRWALSKMTSKIDYQAWAGLAPLLNKYKFAGYINDPSISAWDWLSGNILPWLPISVRTGPNGLTPVLNQLHAITYLNPVTTINIDENSEINRLGPIETTRATEDLVNQFTFSYAKRGYNQDYANQVRVTDKQVKNFDIRSDYSARSINLYGVRNGAGESDYVYDKDTAAMIALQEVARRSMPIRSIDISAPFHYGWIKIGDIINVNSDSLFLKDQACMVIEKQYVNSYWRFKITFEINKIK